LLIAVSAKVLGGSIRFGLQGFHRWLRASPEKVQDEKKCRGQLDADQQPPPCRSPS
jgi:hypothetical protein